MIIALPVDETKEEICPSFGRAPFYMFYNTETEENELKQNPGSWASGGAGLKAAQFIVDNEVDVLITPRCGQNASEVLIEAEMKIYKSEGTSASENIKLYKENKLLELTTFHEGFHGIH